MGDLQSREVLAVAIIFTILSWTSTILRIWVREGMLRSFGRDDWAMVGCQLLFTVYLACQIGGWQHGTGEHLKDLEPWRAEQALKFWFLCEVFYVLSTIVLKIAIGLLLLRVTTKPLHIWIIRLIMITTIIFGGAFDIVILLQCRPIHALWTLDPDDGKCVNVNVLVALTYAVSGLNAFADWTFGLLPFWIVKDSSMPHRQKVLVAAILALAAVGSTATIIRLPFIHTVDQSNLGWNGDFLYATTGVAVWTTVEVGIGITAGNLATLRPLLQLVPGKLGFSSTNLPGTRTGKDHGTDGSMTLSNLAPGHGTVTTIISAPEKIERHGPWHSRQGSSAEYLTYDTVTREVIIDYTKLDSDLNPFKQRSRSSLSS